MRISKVVSLTLAALWLLASCNSEGPAPSAAGTSGAGAANGGTATSGAANGGAANGGAANGGAANGGAGSSGQSGDGGRSGGTSLGGATMGGQAGTGGSSPPAGGGGVAPEAGGTGNVGGTAGVAGGKQNTGGAGGSPASYRPCPKDGTLCKIMPFGDSITDGYNPDTPGGYRVELFRLAHSAGKAFTFVGDGSNGPALVDGVTFPAHHEGHSGWTIAPTGSRSGISTLVATVMPKHTPHIVLLMIGTNDAIDNYDMANAASRLGALIDSIYAQLPSVMIIVAQPIPSRGDVSKGDDAALSARIKAFDDALPAVVKSRADAGKHILLVDMYTPIAPNKASLLEDQWHPNLAGYVLLGSQWYATLKSLL